MKKGSHHSEETREKNRQAHLGENHPFFGKQHSPATRAKIREAHLGEKNSNFGKPRSLETREKIRQAHLGKHLSEETKLKLSNCRKGRPSGREGSHHSSEACEKIRKSLLGHSVSDVTKEKIRQSQQGEKNSNWQGGSSFEEYSIAWTKDLKEAIRKRDKYTCQLCGKKQEELSEKLHIHHIDYDKKNLDPENLISLCRSCHMKTNHKREEWKIVFCTKRKARVE